MMNWKQFKEEEPHWLAIIELIGDRLEIIKADLARPDKTPDLLAVRVLQQEKLDNEFILSLPDIFMQAPEKEKEADDGMATDTE
jgi:hypothetical protein